MSRKRIEKELAALLTKHSGQPDIPVLAEDVLAVLGITGDDANEFFEEFEATYSVDMSHFLWYFHYNGDEPGYYRRVLPYLPNGQVAPYQPITFANLADAAQSGRWEWEYPPHSLKTVGWKDVLQYLLIAIVALWIIASMFL